MLKKKKLKFKHGCEKNAFVCGETSRHEELVKARKCPDRKQILFNFRSVFIADAEKYCSRHVAKALRNLQHHLSSYAEGNGCRSDTAAPTEPQQKRVRRCTDDCDCDSTMTGEFDNVLATGAS